MFANVDGTTDRSVQDIQLDETVGDGMANFQRLDFEAGSACFYTWYTAAKAATLPANEAKTEFIQVPAGCKGVWLKDVDNGKTGRDKKSWYAFPEGEEDVIAQGDCVQLNFAEADKEIQGSGAVSEADMDQTSIVGNNYVGNPFPVAISVQNMQLDATVGDGMANFQRLDFEAGSACFYTWYTAAKAATLPANESKTEFIQVPEGCLGVWLKDVDNGKTGRDKKSWYAFPADTEDVVAAGDGVQLNMAEAEKNITILCPYDHHYLAARHGVAW